MIFILNNVESPPDTDVDEQIPDLFLNLIISYNLQFILESDNMVLKALSGRKVAKIFTEKILLLLNREGLSYYLRYIVIEVNLYLITEDPVRIFDHEPAPPHSLLKLFNDLFSQQSTADLFYTNDVKVLIDIVVRNISDLSSGDKVYLIFFNFIIFIALILEKASIFRIVSKSYEEYKLCRTLS